jgi:hypothetical protein
VMGDRHVGWETALIKAANDRNIPTMIVPFAMSDPASDAEIRLRSPDADQYRVSTWFEKVISRRFPGWVNESQGERLFFTPPGNALAARVLGIMPTLPWTLGGGAARRMAVESPRQREAFLAQGVPLAKMVVTGKPSVDRIYERIQRLEASELREELGIRGDQPVILCSVPQLAEHRLLSWPEHWHETEFLFATLTQQPDAAVILSIHPQSDPEAYRPLANKYGAVIAKQRIYDLIPVCDILVATYSSVVVQAIGCGKPAIVVDFYGLGFTYYDDEPGVLVIRDRDQLAPTIQRLNYNRQYYEQMAEAQRQRAPEWVLLDGQCTQRVVDEIYQMAAD